MARTDTKLWAALDQLRNQADEGITSTSGLTALTRQDAARATLKQIVHQSGEYLSAEPSKPVIRTIHHLACTGGTLISRAIAAQPNVSLLSEIDPFSPLGHSHPFRPTDVVGLAKLSSNPASDETQGKLFLSSLDVLHDDNLRTGVSLVLRDHSHGKYSYGDAIRSQPGLHAFLRETYDLKSVVTVRNPIDSYLSLKKNGWDHFTPNTFDEYCRRMDIFLDDHSGMPIFKYEDFVSNPNEIASSLCSALDLSFNPDFAHLMSTLSVSGDSGRQGDTIRPRPRREISAPIRDDISDSSHHAKLAKRLGYSTAIDLPG